LGELREIEFLIFGFGYELSPIYYFHFIIICSTSNEEDNVNMLLEGTIAENWTKHYTENINGTTNMENLCYM